MAKHNIAVDLTDDDEIGLTQQFNDANAALGAAQQNLWPDEDAYLTSLLEGSCHGFGDDRRRSKAGKISVRTLEVSKTDPQTEALVLAALNLDLNGDPIGQPPVAPLAAPSMMQRALKMIGLGNT